MLKKSIPNIITSLNLFCGFLAIIYIFDEEFSTAILCIVCAMVLDAMDGRAARMLKIEGDFGKELDSLADIVTFGVAPSLMLYHVSFYELGVMGIAVTGLFPICGALRLARFNIETHKKSNYFVGLPITASGVILALFSVNVAFFSIPFVMFILLTLSFLMVSNIKFPNFKNVHFPKNFYMVSMVMLIVIYSISRLVPHVFPYLLIIPIVVFGFILLYKIKHKKSKKGEKNNENEEENMDEIYDIENH